MLTSATTDERIDASQPPRIQVSKQVWKRTLSECFSDAAVRCYSRGEPLFRERDVRSCAYRVETGSVLMSSTLKDGRRQVVGFASAGDYVGLISTRQHAFEARTTTATQIRCAPISMLRRWASEEPSVADDLHEAIGREFARLQAHFLTIGRLDATGRVATFLLMLADKSERKDSGPIEVHVPMLRNDIADFLCISVETVSRTLTELKNMKMIALNGCRIVTLTDRRALAQLTYALSRTTAP